MRWHKGDTRKNGNTEQRRALAAPEFIRNKQGKQKKKSLM